MAASIWDPVQPDAHNVFGFIAVDEHTHKGCVIQEATDLGTRLILINANDLPEDFVLFSFDFGKAIPCRAITRTDEVVEAWFNCDRADVAMPSVAGGADA